MTDSQQQRQTDPVIWEDMWEHAREEEWKNVRRNIWQHCCNNITSPICHTFLGYLRTPVSVSIRAISNAVQDNTETLRTHDYR
jgi:hypothetical protein